MRQIITFLFLVTIISCGKPGDENSLTFKGVVIDYSTNARVPNTTVILLRSAGFPPGGGFSNSISDTTVTNANGEYEITVDNVAGKTLYEIEAKKLGYSSVVPLCLPKFGPRFLNANQNTYHDTTFIDRSTIVTTFINNILPANVNDTLDFSFLRGKTCSSAPPISEYIRIDKQFIGIVTSQYFSDTFSLKSSPIVSIRWTVRNNGIISSIEQPVTPVEFGTTIFNLNY